MPISKKSLHRRSRRSPKKRDFFHTESLVSRGVLEFQRDECRGIDQPGRFHQPSPQEKLESELHHKGWDLFQTYLKPQDWICRKRIHAPDGYVYICSSRITKQQEIPNVTMFQKAKDIYEQYQQDGETMDIILQRSARFLESLNSIVDTTRTTMSSSSTTENEVNNPSATTTTENVSMVAVKQEPTEDTSESHPSSSESSEDEVPADNSDDSEMALDASGTNAVSPVQVANNATNELVSDDSTAFSTDTATYRPPSLGILQRLARMEKAYGLPKDNPFSRETILKRRIERHEEYLALLSNTTGVSILERLKRLEADIGIASDV